MYRDFSNPHLWLGLNDLLASLDYLYHLLFMAGIVTLVATQIQLQLNSNTAGLSKQNPRVFELTEAEEVHIWVSFLKIIKAAQNL